MKIRSLVNVQAFEDAAMRDAIYAPSDDEAEWQASNYKEATAGRFSIAASGSFTVPFGTVGTCAGMHVWALAGANVNVNGLGNIAIAPPSGAASGTPCRIQIEGTVTSIVISNPSSTTALEGRFLLWGDAA